MIAYELTEWEKTGGWIGNWLICGFFDSLPGDSGSPSLLDPKHSGNWEKDMLTPWGGEAGILDVPAATGDALVEWMPVATLYNPRLQLTELRERYSDLDKAMGSLHPDSWDKLWYALSVIQSEQELSTTLHFCGWDGCRLWVNGELLFNEHSYHHIILEKESVPITLKKGTNTILMKLDRDGCAARLENSAGLKSLTTSEPPPATETATIQQLKRWALQKQTINPFTGSTAGELDIWQQGFRNHFHSCLGDFPEETTGDATLVSTQTTDDGIERRMYHLPSEAGMVVPFYLLLPPKEKAKGKYITIAHGHGKQWREIAGTAQPPALRSSQIGPYTGDYGIALARKGFITSVCCERGFSDRDDYRGTQDKCTYAFMLAMAQGYFYPTLQMHDIRRMTTAVMKLPELKDISGPGLTGLSGGGTMTYLLGAYDDTYKACAVWCGMCRYRDYAMGAGCGMQIIPRLWPQGDVGELLSLIAPRPLLVGQGTLDAAFNVITTRSIYADATTAYEAAGMPDRIDICFPEIAHQVDIDRAAQFFDKWL